MEQRGSGGQVGVRRLRIGPQRRALDIAVGASESGGQFGDAGTGLAVGVDGQEGVPDVGMACDCGKVRFGPDPPIRIGILRSGAGCNSSNRRSMRSNPSSKRSARDLTVP